VFPSPTAYGLLELQSECLRNGRDDCTRHARRPRSGKRTDEGQAGLMQRSANPAVAAVSASIDSTPSTWALPARGEVCLPFLCAPSYCAAPVCRLSAWPRGSTPPPATWRLTACIVRADRWKQAVRRVDRRLAGGLRLGCLGLFGGGACESAWSSPSARPCRLRSARLIAQPAGLQCIRLDLRQLFCSDGAGVQWAADIVATTTSPFDQKPEIQ